MSIPSRLRDDSISFCLVEKPVTGDKSSGKKPFQADWPKKNIRWDNNELNQWIKMGGNYGVIGGGSKNLVIIDFDDEKVQQEASKRLPDTFTVRTGSGLLHKYYFTDGGKSFKVLDKDAGTLVDIQSEGKQVVGPGSKHYSGNTYAIEDNKPIATITFKEIQDLLLPYNEFTKGKTEITKKEFKGIDDFQEDLFNSVSIEDLLSEFGVDTSKNPSNCPFHASKGGKCLGWDNETAHCFHCEGAWNKISWIKANKNCEAKEAIEWLAEREGRIKELEESREQWKEKKLEEDIQEIKKIIQGKKETEETIDFPEKEITWTNEYLNWEDMRNDVRKIIAAKNKMFFVCSNKDKIEGKPQLIHKTKKLITLVRKTKVEKGRKGQEETEEKIKFLDEAIDKRSDGQIIDSWSKAFWTYRVISDNQEYYLLSDEEMPIQGCKINGMLMEVNDFAEMNQSLKVKSLSNLFFVHSFEPSVKIVSKEDIVNMILEKNISEKAWTNFLDAHPLGTHNRFPYLSNMLRSAHLLSGKVDGWPLHLAVIGPAGTRKSMGYIETIANKFEEYPAIVEGGNSRVKGLSPSFKEKPANIGYLAKCERMGWIDELGKMVEFETNRHDAQVRNVLGELNFLLDHKRRTVGSGNDNDCVVQANAKFLFVSNPVQKKSFLKDHIGIIDPTTMSRIFWWVQDLEEQNFVISEKGVEKKPLLRLNCKYDWLNEIPPHIETRSMRCGINTKYNNTYLCVCGCSGEYSSSSISQEEFLTLYDTINSFVCEVDERKIATLNEMVIDLAVRPLADMWKSRGPHHIYLLIDGLAKHRCLFRDFDASFKVKEEDYELAAKILESMTRRWTTDLGIKADAYKGGGSL